MSLEPRSPHPGVLSETTQAVSIAAPVAADVLAETHLRAGSVAALRSLRARLGQCLEEGACDPDLVADAQLVLAEIATNAFIHDTAPLVEVRITCCEAEVTISTWHRGEIAPPSYPVSPMPTVGPVITPGGRGLAIVDRIVASREVGNDAGCTTTVVRFRR